MEIPASFHQQLSRLLRLIRLPLNPHDPPRIPPNSLWLIRQARTALGDQVPTATDALIRIGNIEFGLAEYARATAWYTQAAVQALNDKNDQSALTALMNLGATYHAVSDHDRTIAAYGRAIEVAERLADHLQRVNAMISQATALHHAGRQTESKRVATAALVDARTFNLTDSQSRCWILFSLLDYAEGRCDAAIEKLRKSLDLSALSGNLRDQVRGYFNLGLVQADSGELDAAIRSLTRAQELCRSHSIDYGDRIDRALAEISAKVRSSEKSGTQES